jgi:hypothetical protein
VVGIFLGGRWRKPCRVACRVSVGLACAGGTWLSFVMTLAQCACVDRLFLLCRLLRERRHKYTWNLHRGLDRSTQRPSTCSQHAEDVTQDLPPTMRTLEDHARSARHRLSMEQHTFVRQTTSCNTNTNAVPGATPSWYKTSIRLSHWSSHCRFGMAWLKLARTRPPRTQHERQR